MRIKINVRFLVIDMLLLLPITTLFQGVVPVINRALFAVVISTLLMILLQNKFTLKEIMVLFLFLLVYVSSFLITQEIAENVNEYFYLLFSISYYLFVVKNEGFLKTYCKERKNYILNIIRIWCVCLVVSMFFPSSYSGGFFSSFTGNVFRSTAAATFVLSLILMVLAYNKRYIIYAIFPMICILGGGARTYLFVGLAICLIMYYMVMPTKKAFWLFLIPASIIVLAVVFNSSIMDRIISSLVVPENAFYKDPIVRFTSGRSLFWVADMQAYWEGSLFNKLFGFGYNYVYDVNEVTINGRIWAHNDFINILLGYGLIGLVCYLTVFRRMFHAYTYGRGIPKWLKFVVWLVWFFNAFMNMFYTYACAAASYPFILLGLSLFWEEKGKGKAQTLKTSENQCNNSTCLRTAANGTKQNL